MPRNQNIRIGPAGWSYKDWEGVVYPPHAGKKFDPLEYLARFFDTIEINSSFYRPPSESTGKSWATRVAGFIQPSVSIPKVDLVQGAHIVLPFAVTAGIYYVESPADGRAVFVMPWHGATLIGTTETPYRGDADRVQPLPEEEDYLLAVARHYLRERPESAGALVQARNANESRLVRIWEDVLHVRPIGVTDAFLSLGGQSLQAASIASRIAGEFGVRVPLTLLLTNPTIAELNEQIRSAPVIGAAKALPKATSVTLSPAQQRIWFLDQFIPNRAAYNIPLARRIHGRLNIAALEIALEFVLARHETLRSSFASADGQPAIQVAQKSS